MRVTEKLIKQIISLIEGRTVPSSAMKGSWVDELLSEGILICVYSGSRRNYRIRDITAFLGALERHNEMLRDPYKALRLLISGSERSEMAAETGNSKARSARSCPGFAVNSFQPVNAMLGRQEISILPAEGTSLFICDWQSFSIPEDVVVIGVENMENFRKVAQQKAFFMGCFKIHNSLHPEEKVTLADEGLPRMLF
ncbi:MAG: hypothetical protein K2G23_08410, partial [Muribaculaceae bacterium]|nr:hypothetical protein [Muribaculaceae bacterium]